MVISFPALKKRANTLGFTLQISPARVYQLIEHNDHGTAFSGTYEETRHFLLGYEWHKQHTEYNYHLVKKEWVEGMKVEEFRAFPCPHRRRVKK